MLYHLHCSNQERALFGKFCRRQWDDLLLTFMIFCRDAYHQTSTLNRQRALLCEILARRTACKLETSEKGEDRSAPDNHICLSKRFVRLNEDGDESLPTSAMESAADQNW